jgi:hypothetical protein
MLSIRVRDGRARGVITLVGGGTVQGESKVGGRRVVVPPIPSHQSQSHQHESPWRAESRAAARKRRSGKTRRREGKPGEDWRGSRREEQWGVAREMECGGEGGELTSADR